MKKRNKSLNSKKQTENERSQPKKETAGIPKLPEISGFYFDHEQNRYFPILPLSKLPTSSNAMQNLLYNEDSQKSLNSHSQAQAHSLGIQSKEALLKERRKLAIAKKNAKKPKLAKAFTIPQRLFLLKNSLTLSFGTRLTNLETVSIPLLRNQTLFDIKPYFAARFFSPANKFTKLLPVPEKNILVCSTNSGDICQIDFDPTRGIAFDTIKKSFYINHSNYGGVTSISALDHDCYIYSTLGEGSEPGSVFISRFLDNTHRKISFENKSVFTVSGYQPQNLNSAPNFYPTCTNFVVGGSQFVSVYNKGSTATSLFSAFPQSDALSTCIVDPLRTSFLCGQRDGSVDLFDPQSNSKSKSKSKNKDKSEISIKTNSKQHVSRFESHRTSVVSLLQCSERYFLSSNMTGKTFLMDIRWPLSKVSSFNDPTLGTVNSYEPHFGNSGSSLSISLSPEKSTLAIGCPDKTVRIWDVISSKLLREIKCPKSINSVALVPTFTTSYSSSTQNRNPLCLVISSNSQIYKLSAVE